MRALVLESNKSLNYQKVKMPTSVQDKAVLVRVKASGICGSDIVRGFGGKAYHYPLIMGHEFAGTVEESVAGSKYKQGDRVTVFPLLPCKRCEACLTGDFAQCTNYDYYGSRRDGGFAEFVSVPEENLFALPDHVDLLHAAMTEPAAVALHGVRQVKVTIGSTAVVYGCGPIGNMTAQWLRIAGCATVIVVDIDQPKLDIARQMGFVTINSSDLDPVKTIYELTTGHGADIAVEAVGHPATFLNAVRSVGRMGQVVFMGNIQGKFEIGEVDFSNLLRKEIQIFGTWNSKITPEGIDDWSTVLKMMDKQLIVAPLISHTPDLSDGVEIFNAIANKQGSFNKVIFKI
ncbi:MAG: galactitol-1-phosphate 5-dehydrogenase [Prolixibacteraceae bacterium]|jgi:L-iditol 2-dehydrogenase/galactitol-1-phosphate 5-dehydrogenase|nr:galactitol-1-phosphate 5-dehydrogenase [Prolixibacteraceae bacterium]